MKSQEEILNGFLAYLEAEYDITVGSVFYDMLYPVAVEMVNAYARLDTLLSNAYASTASGVYLDRKVAEQGLTRIPPEYATGVIRIYGSKGAVVQTGAKVASKNLMFSVVDGGAITDKGYIDLEARCTTSGKVGNVLKGEINRFPVTLPGLTGVENITAFDGGVDEESDMDLRLRFFNKVSRPTASGNIYHYEEWAKAASTKVGTVKVIPLWNGAGTVKVVIVDSDNQPASKSLVLDVKEYIEKNRPIGANVTVASAEPMSISVSANVTFFDNSTSEETKREIYKAIKVYLAQTALSDQYVSYAKIGKTILSVDGVKDYDSLYVNGNKQNISFIDGVVPVISSVHINSSEVAA